MLASLAGIGDPRLAFAESPSSTSPLTLEGTQRVDSLGWVKSPTLHNSLPKSPPWMLSPHHAIGNVDGWQDPAPYPRIN